MHTPFPVGDNPTCSRGLREAIPTVPVQHLIRFRRNHLQKQRIPIGNTTPFDTYRGYRYAQPTATQKTIPSGDTPPHSTQIRTKHPTNTTHHIHTHTTHTTFPAGDNLTCSRGLSAAIPTVPVQHLIRFRRNHLH